MTTKELYDVIGDRLRRYPKCASEEVKLYFEDDEASCDEVRGIVLRTEGVNQDHLHLVLDLGNSNAKG